MSQYEHSVKIDQFVGICQEGDGVNLNLKYAADAKNTDTRGGTLKPMRGGLSIGNLIIGTLVTETVCAVPGVGRLMLEAIFARDYPLIQGLTLTFAVLVSVVFLLTDVVQSWLDPRLRQS